MKKIGIVSCDNWKNLINEDVFLKEYFNKCGYDSEIISWQDDNVNYQDYECLILRSVWGYQNDYKKFKEWLLFLKNNNIKIYNDVDMVLDNIRKDIQFGILDKNDIEHIPTKFIKMNEEVNFSGLINPNLIIKPIISGSGDNTFRITNDKSELDKRIINTNDIPLVYKKVLENSENGLMIQPYIEEVVEGEYSCVYINSVNTHNMIRFPGIFAAKKKPILIHNIPSEVKMLADRIASLNEYNKSLYLRVDITYNKGIPLIMEVELAEPDLLTKYIDDIKIKTLIGNQFIKGIERKR